MKKTGVYLIILCLLTSIFAISIYALQKYGEFSCWYSDQNSINYFAQNTINTYKYKYTDIGMTTQAFDTYTSNAINSWFSGISLNNTYTTSQSTAQLEIMVMSRATGNNAGLPYNVAGLTFFDGLTQIGRGTYSSSYKYVYSITPKAHVYLVWDSSNTSYNTSSYNDTKWKQVFSHELGHAVGYNGHYKNTSGDSIMYSTSTQLFNQTITTPSISDLNHLNNIY